MSPEPRKSLEVRYVAMLREQRGAAEERLASDAATPRDLYDELRERHRFTLPRNRLRVIVNDEFAPWDIALKDGDVVVFVPPVAGG
jgi:molybdopterin converting factor small subunit